jgi:hypothetical protein
MWSWQQGMKTARAVRLTSKPRHGLCSQGVQLQLQAQMQDLNVIKRLAPVYTTTIAVRVMTLREHAI